MWPPIASTTPRNLSITHLTWASTRSSTRLGKSSGWVHWSALYRKDVSCLQSIESPRSSESSGEGGGGVPDLLGIDDEDEDSTDSTAQVGDHSVGAVFKCLLSFTRFGCGLVVSPRLPGLSPGCSLLLLVPPVDTPTPSMVMMGRYCRELLDCVCNEGSMRR